MITTLLAQRLQLVWPENNETIDNRESMVQARVWNQSLYFRVGDVQDQVNGWQDGNTRNLRLSILYFDNGTETIQIVFSTDGTTETTETIVTKGNTGKWKWASRNLTATPVFAHFVYQEQNNADFRIVSTGDLGLVAVVVMDRDTRAEASWFAQPLMLLEKSTIGGHGDQNTVAAASTDFMGIFLTGTKGSAVTARSFISTACILKNFRVRTNSAQSGTGTLVLTVMISGAATALEITVTGAAGEFNDLTNQALVAAGDSIEIRCVNNAPAAVSAQIGGWSIEMDKAV